MPIRPIRTSDDHAEALAEIAALFEAAPGTPEADRLEVLVILVADYERRLAPLPAPDPVELIGFAMLAQGHSQADLAALLGSRSRASEILNRRRALSAEMVGKLAQAWSLPARLLAAPYRVQGPLRRAALRGAAALGMVMLLLSATVSGLLYTYGRDLPSVSSLAYRQTAPGHVALADLPPHVVKAFLAAEDRNYYGHEGNDFPAMLRASLTAVPVLLRGETPGGAATIPQQLAKNLLLDGEGPTIERKVRQVLLAQQLEARFTKDEILDLYLNALYFGGGIYGIGPAAKTYFGKPAADLSVAEAAALAALPKAPETYRFDLPENRARAQSRRNWVLTRMQADGLITPAAAKFAQAEPLVIGH